MSNSTSLQQLQQRPVAVPQPAATPTNIGFFNLEGFELMQRIAKAFSQADMVPKQYQGSIPNCMIALDMAQRIGANPLQVMQNLYIVHGTPGWSAKFLIATVNTCGRYSSLRYEWKGEPNTPEFGCRAWAVENKTGERLDGIWVTWEMVNAEGWASKNGSKWKTMPDQMFIYRAASFWQRAYAPDLGMGLQTAEEVHDIYDAGRGEDGSYVVDVEALREAGNKTFVKESNSINHTLGETLDMSTGEITEPEKEPVQAKTEAKPQRQTRKAEPAQETEPAYEQEDDGFDLDME